MISEKNIIDYLRSGKSRLQIQSVNMYLEFVYFLQIYHRRLAVRNVVLKQQANGLVAKLIGFGPSAEDMANNDDSAGTGVSFFN